MGEIEHQSIYCSLPFFYHKTDSGPQTWQKWESHGTAPNQSRIAYSLHRQEWHGDKKYRAVKWLMAIPNGTVAELKTTLVFKMPLSMEQALNLVQLAGKCTLACWVTVGSKILSRTTNITLLSSRNWSCVCPGSCQYRSFWKFVVIASYPACILRSVQDVYRKCRCFNFND